MKEINQSISQISDEIKDYNKARSKTWSPAFIVTLISLIFMLLSVGATFFTINSNLENRKLEIKLEALKSVKKLVDHQNEGSRITKERILVFETLKRLVKDVNKGPELSALKLVLADECFSQSYYKDALSNYSDVVNNNESSLNMKELAYREMGMINYCRSSNATEGAKNYALAAELDVPGNHKRFTYQLRAYSMVLNILINEYDIKYPKEKENLKCEKIFSNIPDAFGGNESISFAHSKGIMDQHGIFGYEAKEYNTQKNNINFKYTIEASFKESNTIISAFLYIPDGKQWKEGFWMMYTEKGDPALFGLKSRNYKAGAIMFVLFEADKKLYLKYHQLKDEDIKINTNLFEKIKKK